MDRAVTHQPGLGRRLKALRVSRGLSLKEVGAETGVSSSFISMVETGRNDLSVGRLVMLADFYGVGLDDILPGRDTDRHLALRGADGTAGDFAALVFVRRGVVMIDFAEESSAFLGEGDSVWFEAGRRHRQVNIGAGEARPRSSPSRTGLVPMCEAAKRKGSV